MKERITAGKPPVQDVWGGSTRIGYEDRPTHQPRKIVTQRKGSGFLRSIGGLLVVGGMAWVTFVATSPGGLDTLLKPGMPSRPVLVLVVGLAVLLLEKIIK